LEEVTNETIELESPEEGMGQRFRLGISGKLVHQPFHNASSSAAVLERGSDAQQVTIAPDETKTVDFEFGDVWTRTA